MAKKPNTADLAESMMNGASKAIKKRQELLRANDVELSGKSREIPVEKPSDRKRRLPKETEKKVEAPELDPAAEPDTDPEDVLQETDGEETEETKKRRGRKRAIPRIEKEERKSEKLTVKLTKTQMDRLQNMAEATNRKLSALANMFIEEGLDKYEWEYRDGIEEE